MDKFDDIEPGDRVIVVQGGDLRIAKADRVTKTQVVVGNQRYRKSDGFLVGGNTWSTMHILLAEGEALETVYRQRLANSIWTNIQPMLDRRALAKLDIADLMALAHDISKAAKSLEAASGRARVKGGE